MSGGLIRVSCTACGAHCELTAAEVSLNVCADDPGISFYAWACNECCGFISRAADPVTVRLLIAAGVRARVWSVPEPHVGPPITEADLLAFGLALEATPSGVSRFDPARTT